MHRKISGIHRIQTVLPVLLLLFAMGCMETTPQPQPDDERPSDDAIVETDQSTTVATNEQEKIKSTGKPDWTLATFDLDSAVTVSLVQLDGFANGQPFSYVGSDQSWHYFRVKGGFYRLSHQESLPPTPPENGRKQRIGYVGLPMEFVDGELTARYPTDEFPTGSF
ncbi:hypothetical protein Rcae01_00798 [Novipirellula caenicola]|uniref:Uncharacterized protein n=2 Tax=Novipirellula caenicola TaxID=1536901 RepID=A0ABP9VJG9_9BACT